MHDAALFVCQRCILDYINMNVSTLLKFSSKTTEAQRFFKRNTILRPFY